MKQFLSLLLLITSSGYGQQTFDTIIRQGTIYDGSGRASFVADVGINKDTITFIGNLSTVKAKKEINAQGLAVAPGFINMLSWADEDLMSDGRSMSDIKQGVTLEVFGEGVSPGPRTVKTKKFPWISLGDYFALLERKGVSPNFASFVGATTIRLNELNQQNIAPNSAQLQKMKVAVSRAMEEGALGLSSSLIYAPADYASTTELIELSKVAASYNGMYITHMRSEGDKIFIGLNETFQIAREAKIRTEIYHLKINQERNWNKIDRVIAKIDSAQKAGLKITADIYPYNASGTSLTSRIPTWAQEGGAIEMRKRFKDLTLRAKILFDMKMGIPSKNSDPKDVMLMQFHRDSLNKLYRGKRLNEVAQRHGKNADETVLDLVAADKSPIGAIFFLMSEQNVKQFMQLPYISFCSDAGSIAAENSNLNKGAHPRTYGSFARVLGPYVREQKLFSLEEAIRKLTSLPATNLNIKKRGSLKVGNYADVVVFDAKTIKDNATFALPHQYATGMVHVFVNGVHVLRDGEHTGALPGRSIKGPGWIKNNSFSTSKPTR
jgi:N-acyl-D-amino-acid deacylase